MDTVQPHPQVRFFDRDAIVDFFLLLALVNVVVGLLEIGFGMVGALAPSLRVVMTIAAAGALLKMGSIKRKRKDDVATGFPDPVVHDLRTGLLNRQAFFLKLDASLKRGSHGFLLLVHANDISAIDDRFGTSVGDHFVATLLARFDPTIEAGDLLGRLDRDTYAAFLNNRTQDEVEFIGRRLCGATLIPLGDSVDRAQLSACVGFTEVAPKEPILDALERANEAMGTAQQPDSTRVEMWKTTRKKGKIYTSF